MSNNSPQLYKDYSEIVIESTTSTKTFTKSRLDISATLSTKESQEQSVPGFLFSERQELDLVGDLIKNRKLFMEFHF
jgi:hypothetical protein